MILRRADLKPVAPTKRLKEQRTAKEERYESRDHRVVVVVVVVVVGEFLDT